MLTTKQGKSHYKCELCNKTTKADHWNAQRASVSGWMIMRDDHSYCPDHLPVWVEPWREKKRKEFEDEKLRQEELATESPARKAKAQERAELLSMYPEFPEGTKGRRPRALYILSTLPNGFSTRDAGRALGQHPLCWMSRDRINADFFLRELLKEGVVSKVKDEKGHNLWSWVDEE